MYDLGKQFHFNFDKAKTNPNSIIQGANYRISVLTERLVRIEYNKSGIFVDTPTQLVLCRNFPVPKFELKQDSKFLEITTQYFKLTYTKNTPISSSSLKILLKDSETLWYYKHPEVRTYDASLISLDVENKYIKGIYSNDGISSVDDSNSLLIDINGNLIKRIEESIDIYVFAYKNDFNLALSDYFSLTGKAQLIPRYALGNWWSKNYAYNESTIYKLFNRFEKEQIPISVLLLDKDWHITNNKNITGYTFNSNLINNPFNFISKMHNNGVKVGININPIEGIYPHEQMYKRTLEYIRPNENGIISFAPFNPIFLDILMKIMLHPLENMGVDFFWLDYPNNERLSHYFLTHYLYLDSGRNESKRNMLISRNPLIAAHRYGILYSGRTKISFDTLKKLSYINLSAANIGVSWWSHDVGGYSGGMEDSELYLRWIQFGCFSPIFRISVSGGRYYKREPWRWDVKTFEIVKYYMQLRHKLIPYLYSEAFKYYDVGLPITKPLYHYKKELFYDNQYKNEYMFGSQLLISPLTDKKDLLMNRVVHKFYLPEGTWYDFKNGKKFPGGRSYVSFFKDEDYPVFASGGAIIPLDNNISNNSNYTDLEIHIFPGKSNSYQLYEDDGITNLYKSGYFLKTLIDYNYQDNNYTVIIRSIEGKSGIIPPTRNYKIRFRNTLKTNNVIVNFDGVNLNSNVYQDEKDFIIEIKNVKTIGQLSINCKGIRAEIDSISVINEDIDSIISDLEVDTVLKDKIASILFSNLTIKQKRIQIRKLKNDKLDNKFIKMFLRLLEYVEQI